jgi:Flp pilus assembly protein TadG
MPGVLKHRTGPPFHRKRRGAAVVEFALVSPVFLLVLLALFEFARLNVLRNTANNAAYEAVRQVVVPGATAQEAIDEASLVLQSVGTENATITVNPSVIDSETSQVTVTVAIPFNDNGFFLPIFANGLVIRSSSTHKTERYRGLQ